MNIADFPLDDLDLRTSQPEPTPEAIEASLANWNSYYDSMAPYDDVCPDCSERNGYHTEECMTGKAA